MHRPLAVLCLLAAAMSIALADSPAPTVSGTPAAIGGADSVTVDAFTAPHEQRQLSSQAGGVVKKVLVEEGDHVTAGQPLVEFNDALLQAQLAVSQARIQSAEAQIAAAKARHEMLSTEYEREQKLFDKEVASQEDLDKARLDRDLAQLAIENSENDKTIATLTANRDQEAVNQTIIKAPIDADILRIAVRGGEAAQPLSPVLSVVAVDPLDVIAYVPIGTVGRIRVGSTAELKLETVPADPLQCSVKVVDRVADPASGTYRVKLTLPNPDRKIAAGARGSLTFDLSR
jgi:RND family efflux transporter MFP subunit